ncbi:hypothetical protein D9757_011244 [Collybiopsis confluens]|uniref:Phosphatidate phosphatase APP1 catalytic domain-containing protein n=1 Tax=Collybiopsis confluens TaxID=2823264 RepID=A0A8H5LSK7_9AGAR|nr:hypothetical protein D9757_011244 [Collybiopsis confluens]
MIHAAKDTLKVVNDFENKLTTAVERMKLFGTIGVPEVHIKVPVQGCSHESKLPNTEFNLELGFVSADASLGSCPFTAGTALKTAKLSSDDSDTPSATVFYSSSEGLGVILDVDDSIKITNVLNKSLVTENTLYKDPVPVAGMPDLYSHLLKSLTTKSIPPQFLYVSGSPSNYTLSSPSFFSLIFRKPMISGDADEGKVDYKVKQINRIQGMYPKKRFLAVGDSTEMDPEVCGKIFKQHEGFLRCIWIHMDGAKNSQARFDAAFEGIPKDKYRLYKDSDIGTLKDIDVARGKC